MNKVNLEIKQGIGELIIVADSEQFSGAEVENVVRSVVHFICCGGSVGKVSSEREMQNCSTAKYDFSFCWDKNISKKLRSAVENELDKYKTPET